MSHWYVALLRAITNIPMLPLRQRMEALGFGEVESYGMSGNLLFHSDHPDAGELERTITTAFGTLALVRSRKEVAQNVAEDPFGSAILFLANAPTAVKQQAFLKLAFDSPRPVLQGRTVYYLYPSRLQGSRSPLDFERALGVQGTARSARVVRALLARLEAAEARES